MSAPGRHGDTAWRRQRYLSVAGLLGSSALAVIAGACQWSRLVGSGAAPVLVLAAVVAVPVLYRLLSSPAGFGSSDRPSGHWSAAGRAAAGLSKGRAGSGGMQARWATAADVAPLRVAAAERGRLVLGKVGRELLACEPNQSLVVVGPSQTMKTSGLAIPTILEWDGPVLAASVKSDLLRSTFGWRATLGTVSVFDPTGSTGYETADWCPLGGAHSWPAARRIAATMCQSARVGEGRLDEADFWYSLAAKLLAPLLLAAARGGLGMEDVARWVDTQEMGEAYELLRAAGSDEALQAAQASWGREERQRSSVYTTAETVLESFADRPPAPASRSVDIGQLLAGGSDTLYLCAPAHDQSRLRPLFSSLIEEVLRRAYSAATRSGAPLARPLLVVLDEAANIAPLADLDTLAATAAGHGIQLLTVFQDLAQVAARYGVRAATVFNNHRAKLILSGVSDQVTLDQVSMLAGEADVMSSSRSRDARGGFSTTVSPVSRRLAPPDMIRRIRPGHALLVYGHLPPVELRLRPYFADPGLRARVGGSAPGQCATA
ncbi:MAG: type IV secretory system conjugative DNA transfer family protein [Actinomycetota bacterium]|nr:type IV secretory system conjugative DNA transfer family protein [Actinomycetota bacterium]